MNFVQPIREFDKINEIKNILKRQSGRDYMLFIIGINTGLRISDILSLKVNDVLDREHIILIEKKTGKTKRHKINDDLRKNIRDYTIGLSKEDYLFPSVKTKVPISRVQAYRILNGAARQAGVGEIGTHTLRKTFGYHFFQKTKDIVLLQNLFNHSAPSVTLRYIGINHDMMDKAMEEFSL